LTPRKKAIQYAVCVLRKILVFGGKSMPQCKIRSFSAKPEKVERRWYHVDATDQVLGRLAARIATVLMGKHKPTYTPHVDTGDFVIVTNAHKVKVTGRKTETMAYPRYSYYPGGYQEIPFKRVLERHPERILYEAVRRMLPKNALARHMLKKLRVYASDTHPHQAQHPEPLRV
jgi:large subunit ribosomal protein L13